MSSQETLGEPRRLVDDPGVDATLRNDLGVSTRPLVAVDVDAGLLRLRDAIAQGAGAGLEASTGAAVGGGTAGGLRLVGWLLGTVLVVGGGAALSMRDAERPEAPSELAPGTSGARMATAEAEDRELDALPGSSGVVWKAPPGDESLHHEPVAEVANELAPPVDEGDASAALNLPGGIGTKADAPPRPASRAKKPGATAEDDSLAREIQQLAAARRSLADDPARTLALAEQGAEEFPNGAYVQEREGYAILALVALGRADEAKRRAERFLARYPQGTMAARVRRAVEP